MKKPLRIGDRIIFGISECKGVIVSIDPRTNQTVRWAEIRFDDDSEGGFDVHDPDWEIRRLVPKKVSS